MVLGLWKLSISNLKVGGSALIGRSRFSYLWGLRAYFKPFPFDGRFLFFGFVFLCDSVSVAVRVPSSGIPFGLAELRKALLSHLCTLLP